MSDIVDRLRAAVPRYEGTPIAWPCEVRSELLMEAAAQIEHWRSAHETACAGGDLLREEVERLRGELDTTREQLKAAVTLLAEWCHAIDDGGASWDEWDDHYKKARWGLGILRSLIDVEIAKLEDGR